MRQPRTAVLLALVLASGVPSFAAAAKPSTAHAAASMPDWSGAWARASGGFYEASPGATAFDPKLPPHSVPTHPPYNAKFEAIFQENLKRIAAERYPDPISICGTPAGWPRLLGTPDAYEFVVRPEQTWILSENGPNVMRIYTDGRGHPKPDDMWLTYTGNNVGHWDRDTLVFDSIGMKGVGSVILGRGGVVMSDKLHVSTRMRLIAPDRLMIAMVLDDPDALTAPWPLTFTFTRLPKGSWVYDYACAENNRNPIRPDGKTLTLDTNGKVVDTSP